MSCSYAHSRVPNHCAALRPKVSSDDDIRYKQRVFSYHKDTKYRDNFSAYSSNYWTGTANANNSSNAWNVNFNNGNANNNNRNNNKYVRLVRGGEWLRVPACFEAIYHAWLACRRRKRKTPQAQRYEINLLDNLMAAVHALRAKAWQPLPPVCFVVTQPKGREVHAAHFADRVIHHYLVPQLEVLYEPVFIHDVYSNRKNKGTHSAVVRLQKFMRSVQGTQPQCATDANKGGYYLQLDIANFFNNIDRPTLFSMLQKTLAKAAKKQQINNAKAEELRDLCHRILKQDVAVQSRLIATPQEYSCVPMHKRLSDAVKNKGLPIGNLTSQLFANIYLNGLDQFVKHQLKCRYYIRYVDDFILLHHSREQLQCWQQQIEYFLAEQLSLRLRAERYLRPINDGADFLGYIVRPNYSLVRRRVVANLWAKLQNYESEIIHGCQQEGWLIRVTIERCEQLRSLLASYWGHFKHANSYRLRHRVFKRFAWLNLFFNSQKSGLTPLWQPQNVSSYRSQCRYFQRLFPLAAIDIQKGWRYVRLPTITASRCFSFNSIFAYVTHLRVNEQGYCSGGLKRRCYQQLTIKSGVALCGIQS